METAVAEDNALMGNLAYILPASMLGALKTTAKDTGSGLFVADGDQLNGYNAIVSNQCTAGDMYFGNFADFDYFTDFDDFTVVVPRKSKRADQINYAALLLYFADLAYSDATSMSTLADRVNLAALPLNLRFPTNYFPA